MLLKMFQIEVFNEFHIKVPQGVTKRMTFSGASDRDFERFSHKGRLLQSVTKY